MGNVHSEAKGLDTVSTYIYIYMSKNTFILLKKKKKKLYEHSCSLVIFPYTKSEKNSNFSLTLNQTRLEAAFLAATFCCRLRFWSKKIKIKNTCPTVIEARGSVGCLVSSDLPILNRGGKGHFWLLSSLWVKD